MEDIQREDLIETLKIKTDQALENGDDVVILPPGVIEAAQKILNGQEP